MTSRDFCFWLQGFFELNTDVGADPEEINMDQVRIIRNHLNLVFRHDIDPSMGGDQEELQAIHDGRPTEVPMLHVPWIGGGFDDNTIVRC